MSAPLPEATSAPSSLLRASLRAARANLVPGLVLQCFAAGLVAAYYFHPAARAALESLARFRLQAGLPFDLVTTAFFGALLPFAVLRLQAATRHRYNGLQVLALTSYWAYKGGEVSLFYRVQAIMFGEGSDFSTIVLKTTFDQFIYCPLFAVPVTWLVYTWAEHRFDSRVIRSEWRRPGWYGRCVLPLLVATWSVWVPAVAIIYLLPTALQLPLQNVVLCFFTLMVIFLTKRSPDTPSP